MEQREDQEAVVGGRDPEGVGGHGAHGGDVGVVEHDALGLAGRPAGVDEQGQGVGVDDRAGVASAGPVAGPVAGDLVGRLQGQHVGGDGDDPVEDRCAIAVDEDLGARVGELVLRFGRGERRVDRRDGGAEAPGGEQGDEELDPVGQHDRHHVAPADAEVGEGPGGAVDAVAHVGVAEQGGGVGQAGGAGSGGGPPVGEIGQRGGSGGEGHAADGKDPSPGGHG